MGALTVLVAGCAAAHPATGPRAILPTVSLTAPAAQGGVARVLWRGAAWDDLTVSGSVLIGVTQDAHAAQVHAIRAVTGAPGWSVSLPASLPWVLGLVPASGVVIVEAGHGVGQAPAMAFPVVTEYIALNLDTGKELWTVPVGGTDQSPPAAVAGSVLLTGDTSGAVVARAVATGAELWRDPRPVSCRLAPSAGAANAGLGLAADGTLVTASFDCGPAVIVQRLDATSGRPLWTWTSPAVASGAGMSLSVTAVASVVLLTGQIGSVPAAAQFAARLPHPYGWPASLGPPDQVSTVLVLSAADGQPLWSELGGQMVTFTLTSSAVCETSSIGLECRADVTGATTMPDLVTGQAPGDGPTYTDLGFAGVPGDIAAVTVAASGSGSMTLRVITSHGTTAVQTPVAIGISAYGGIAVWPLAPDAILVLVRDLVPRTDVTGSPVLALRVPLG
jgi:outer membrane protein assembly factor BamB